MSPGMYGNIGPGVSSMYGNSLSPFRSLEQPVVEQQGKGKGKMREEDFEAAFAQFTASMDNASLQSARVEELDDLGEKLAESSLDDGVTDFKQCVSIVCSGKIPITDLSQSLGSATELGYASSSWRHGQMGSRV